MKLLNPLGGLMSATGSVVIHGIYLYVYIVLKFMDLSYVDKNLQ